MKQGNWLKLGDLNRTHGASGTLTWNRWRSMKARCTLPNTKSYPRYGGRGITVCDRWLCSFENFLADMGECPSSNFTLERNDNNGNYEPNNWRWATRKEQNRNSSRTHRIFYHCESHCLSEWAEIFDIPRTTMTAWLKQGLSMQQIIDKHAKLKKPRRGKARVR